MTTTHIMLDIETWGKTPGSDIRSIGACVFDPVIGYVAIPDGDNPELQFYIATDNPTPVELINVKEKHGAIDEWAHWDNLSECYRKYPLTRDPETVEWWNKQSAEAQAAFANPVDLREACLQFSSWIYNLLPVTPPDGFTDLRVWANDPHFDVSILAAVFRGVGLPEPWHYRSPRSQKTITEAAGMTRDDYVPFAYGTEHNALDDAISQAMIVCEAYRRLGIRV